MRDNTLRASSIFIDLKHKGGGGTRISQWIKDFSMSLEGESGGYDIRSPNVALNGNDYIRESRSA